MATRNDLTGSNYFNVEELNSRGGKANLTIESVGEKEFTDQNTGKTSTKIIISFQGEKKKLTRGKMNINEMFDILPDDTDDWEGERVQLYVGKVDFGGKRVDGVRVRRVPPKNSAAPVATKQQKAPIEQAAGEDDDRVASDDADDDDIPY